ncbi:Multidrug resistance protein 1 [Entomortierella beljakovae]|nr:Multidrug resistance protein 1 [Entomortierella beljakovae]
MPSDKVQGRNSSQAELNHAIELGPISDGDTINPSEKDGKEKSENEPKVTYFQLYRFASSFDMICVVTGTVCSLVSGVGMPLVSVLLGDVVTKITTTDIQASAHDVRIIVIKFTVVGAIMFVAAYGQMCCWTLSAENQSKRIREKYLHAILRQDMAWHDTCRNSESLNTRLNADTQLVFDGLADKVGMIVSGAGTFIAGFVIAFTHGWRMTLVLLSAFPLMAGGGFVTTMYGNKSASDGQDAYATAGGLAEQAISSIRTVVAFDGQNREIKNYERLLDDAYRSGVKKAIGGGAGLGFIMLVMFLSYALAFWFGAREVRDGRMETGEVLTVLVATLIGSFSLGNVGPYFGALGNAQVAAHGIFKIIDRVPPIDSSSELGLKPASLKGHIVLKDVDFVYPSRPEIPILNKMSIEVIPGQTVALVGLSGSGKSTIIGLLERFYDPIQGSIKIDGIEVKDYNVRYLRDCIGLVSQEPVLFNATIRQNLMYGTRKDQEVPTDKEIEQACRLANAHDFISKLPGKYETPVGDKGALLSGGQKQRIAIARALIRNPGILLLDEATSALDTESERIVQEALDKASAGRSTVVVAHRLSTIINADLIYVMEHGHVVASGTHESLLAQGGLYAEFVSNQQLKTRKVQENDDLVMPTSSSPSHDHVKIVDEIPDKIRRTFSRKLSGMSSTKSDLGRSTTAEVMDEAMPDYEREKKEAAKKLRLQNAPITRTIKYMRPDISLVTFGVFFAFTQGAIFPVFSQVLSNAIKALSQYNTPSYDLIQKANHSALLFVFLAAVAFVGFGGAQICFMIVGERVTRRMRSLSYRAILSQEMAFFDRPENSTGALTSRLATDSQQMFDMVSQVLLIGFATVATVGCGLGFGFAASWQMSLIIIAVVPIVGLGQYLETAALNGFGEKTRKAYERSGQVAGEAIANIKTVALLAKEDVIEKRYIKATESPHKYAVKKTFYASFGYAFAQAFSYWSYSIGFYGGYRLVEAYIITWDQMFRCMFSIVFMGISLGIITSELPKYSKGKLSAINIYELLDKATTIDVDQPGLELERVEGSVSLNKVDFSYPTRSDIAIFKGLSVEVAPGQTVALVGPSGCGKSTIIALLERWYNVDGGCVMVDQHNLKDLQLHNIRNHMSLVGQEPVLFDTSIGENILYGLPDGKGTHAQIEAAAKMANIHNFIISLPQGYNTKVGDKGSQLSGGQKQRIAIARAMIREPKLLLLDEATSALDSESEKLVQEALDQARAGRTTIVIAHRLSTVQDADLILVIKDGSVVQSGKHFELLQQGGLYADLCQSQNLL